MKNKIYGIGHSNRAFSEFLNKLKENEIDIIIDIRTYPRSRFCPWYNLKRLSKALEEENITYIPKGDNIGGMGENTRYTETLDELVDMIKQDNSNICLMCSEADYKQCHRYDVIAPDLEKLGIEMHHILYDKRPKITKRKA